MRNLHLSQAALPPCGREAGGLLVIFFYDLHTYHGISSYIYMRNLHLSHAALPPCGREAGALLVIFFYDLHTGKTSPLVASYA